MISIKKFIALATSALLVIPLLLRASEGTDCAYYVTMGCIQPGETYPDSFDGCCTVVVDPGDWKQAETCPPKLLTMKDSETQCGSWLKAVGTNPCAQVDGGCGRGMASTGCGGS